MAQGKKGGRCSAHDASDTLAQLDLLGKVVYLGADFINWTNDSVSRGTEKRGRTSNTELE
jgi:hypothetical protein